MGFDLAQYGLIAIGESLVILSGGIDLSVGPRCWAPASSWPPGLLASWLIVLGAVLGSAIAADRLRARRLNRRR